MDVAKEAHNCMWFSGWDRKIWREKRFHHFNVSQKHTLPELVLIFRCCMHRHPRDQIQTSCGTENQSIHIYPSWQLAGSWCIYIRSTQHPVRVANKGLKGFPSKHVMILVRTVSGWGVNPMHSNLCIYVIHVYPGANHQIDITKSTPIHPSSRWNVPMLFRCFSSFSVEWETTGLILKGWETPPTLSGIESFLRVNLSCYYGT